MIEKILDYQKTESEVLALESELSKSILQKITVTFCIS